VLTTVGVLAAVVLVAKRFAPKMGAIDWEQRFQSMPENAPPKWMFRNISEIHDNSERILALMEERVEDGNRAPEAEGEVVAGTR
jgi:hypothetical protein